MKHLSQIAEPHHDPIQEALEFASRAAHQKRCARAQQEDLSPTVETSDNVHSCLTEAVLIKMGIDPNRRQLAAFVGVDCTWDNRRAIKDWIFWKFPTATGTDYNEIIRGLRWLLPK